MTLRLDSLLNSPGSSRTRGALVLLLLAVTYAVLERSPDTSPGATPLKDDSRLIRLFQEKRSGEMVEGIGTVERLLDDDNDGSRHQRFIIRLRGGHTLLVSHNIDLASRIADLDEGDQVVFRGQYEWNDRGGVLHWTHHDPDGHRQGGWLEHQGETYR